MHGQIHNQLASVGFQSCGLCESQRAQGRGKGLQQIAGLLLDNGLRHVLQGEGEEEGDEACALECQRHEGACLC